MIDFGENVVQPRKPFCWYYFLLFRATIFVLFSLVGH